MEYDMLIPPPKGAAAARKGACLPVQEKSGVLSTTAPIISSVPNLFMAWLGLICQKPFKLHRAAPNVGKLFFP